MSAGGYRDRLLSRLAETARPAEMPPAWRSRRHFDKLPERFRQAQENVHGQVIETASLDQAFSSLAGLLDEMGAGEIVVTGEALLQAFHPAPGSGTRVHRQAGCERDPAAWREVCAGAGAGVTGVEALLAETGTLVVRSGPRKSRLVSLLPPVHIAVAPLSLLTTDLFTWLAGRGGAWPANTVLISGPSKTADIEQTMSVGVHGPRRLITILYRD